MGVSITKYGNQKAIFANQDDGIFSAVPITFDESVLTLETYSANSRRFVKAGSLVKYGNTVKGITAEEYEITNGPINGRVVLEGYAYVQNLTQAAAESMSLLPKIVPIPYGKVLFDLEHGHGLTVFLRVSGSVWKNTVDDEMFTVSWTDKDNEDFAISEVAKVTNDESLLEITFTGLAATDTGVISITAIADTALVSTSGKVISGLPIDIQIKNGEVCINA